MMIYSTGEAAKELGIKRDALLYHLNVGKLKDMEVKKVGGRRMFSSEDIETIKAIITKEESDE